MSYICPDGLCMMLHESDSVRVSQVIGNNSGSHHRCKSRAFGAYTPGNADSRVSSEKMDSENMLFTPITGWGFLCYLIARNLDDAKSWSGGTTTGQLHLQSIGRVVAKRARA